MPSEKKFRYQHILSSVENKAPEANVLLEGEIAVNKFSGKEKLFIKNSSGDIISFIPEHTVNTMIKELTDRLNRIDPYNGHEYVDLGLPSGTLWAKTNVGATNEEDYGLHFAWGDTQGYTFAEREFSWNNYKWGSSSETLTKYNASDEKEELELEDDSVAANWGGQWHMPSSAQTNELFTNTTSAYTSVNNVEGLRFTAQNGKSIFFPFAGIDASSVGEVGFMWTKTLTSPDQEYAYPGSAYFSVVTPTSVAWRVVEPRFYGYSCRGVIG